MPDILTKIFLGDSREVLTEIDNDTIDLIVTSPPYADRRKNTYGGIDPEQYVLQFATLCNNKNHSAAFPEELPEWFIKLFTQENDWFLDPFLGSGTTSEVSQRMRRNSIGIEIIPEYVEMTKAKFYPYLKM